MSRQRRQSQKRSKSEQLEIVVRFLNAGKTQAEAAAAAGVNVRTVQRWVADPQIKLRLAEFQQQTDAIVKSDPMVLTVTQVREQVQQILSYREAQANFANQMGLVVQKSSAVLLNAIDRIEANPDEFSSKQIPQLLRATVDAFSAVSNAWSRATALDDILERLKADDSEIDSLGR
jgi:transposase-like protein